MKKYTVLVLVLLLTLAMLTGCRRRNTDTTSEPTLMPTTGMTNTTTSPSGRDTTPGTMMPDDFNGTNSTHGTNGTDGMDGMDGMDGNDSTHMTNGATGDTGTGDSGATEDSTMPQGRANNRRPY